ncbi:Cuticle protein [Homarus americanus]|uniref:Cuticle protein n=1 Tax=Homarus americanus TaxID=6706 RepID=A0A8J5JP29_HOMAM|nr:Cuticle protein [Homarus americanus]
MTQHVVFPEDQVLLACLVAVTARPHPDRDAQTVVDERQDDGDGNFYYRFETSNSITEDRQGTPGVEGQSNMQGSYSFTHPDGTVYPVLPPGPLFSAPRPLVLPSRPIFLPSFSSVLLACLVALATAAPRPDKDAVILADQRQIGPDGSFNFNYETSNGIAEDRAGNPGVEGQINMQGTYSDQVLLACLVAVTAAAPHPDRDAQTVVDERQDDGDGNFYYRFEASNSITEERQGTPGVEGQSNMQGSYLCERIYSWFQAGDKAHSADPPNDNMKLVLLACLVALATAAPRPDKDAVILADQRQIGPDGSFIFNYETSNGIAEDRAGNPGVEGQINMQGTYSLGVSVDLVITEQDNERHDKILTQLSDVYELNTLSSLRDQVLLTCLVALAAAAPHPDRDAVIVADERQDDGDGNFYYRYETSNAIEEERQGTPGVEGQSNMQGSYSDRPGSEEKSEHHNDILGGGRGDQLVCVNKQRFIPISSLHLTDRALPIHLLGGRKERHQCVKLIKDYIAGCSRQRSPSLSANIIRLLRLDS